MVLTKDEREVLRGALPETVTMQCLQNLQAGSSASGQSEPRYAEVMITHTHGVHIQMNQDNRGQSTPPFRTVHTRTRHNASQ